MIWTLALYACLYARQPDGELISKQCGWRQEQATAYSSSDLCDKAGRVHIQLEASPTEPVIEKWRCDPVPIAN